jgi:bifunctional enzyme CysN/CysC
MVTGASTADIALILVDVRRGVVEQSRRHALLASLLGVRHLVVCVNKMDLVDWSEDAFERVREEFSAFASRLNVHDLTFVPVSALYGGNVVERTEQAPWFDGAPLLHHLERLYVGGDRNLIDVRFPVQYVIRPQSSLHPDYRGYAGTVASGVLRPGDPVLALPSGFTSTIASIDTPAGPVAEAFPPMAVAIRLTDDIDLSRGDLICRPHNAPRVLQDLDARVCWMDETSALTTGRKYAIKHTTRWGRAIVRDVAYRIDISTGHRDESATQLGFNDIGRIHLRTTVPLFIDNYAVNQVTGAFILVDEPTNRTVAAGMVESHPS